MKSAIAFSKEIDNLKQASEDLADTIRKKIKLGKTAVGIAYCDADVDVANLGKLLHENLGIDIIGLTTTATVERHTGYNDMGIVLSVMTGDDVDITVGCTGELNNNEFKKQIQAAYADARKTLPEDPKLILLCAPYIPDLTSENYLEILDEASNHAPIFGGVATDHYDLQYQKTFYNGKSFEKGAVFLLISGNVKPVFAMEHHFSTTAKRKGVITQSSGNQVQKIGNQTFKEFIEEIMPVPNDESVIFYFQTTPFVMELPDYDKSEQPVARALCTIDHQTGAGGFLSKMPEGSTLSINVIQRENLKESCEGALDHLILEMKKEPDYEYSMVFISTCNARHLLMADTKDLESNIIIDKFKNLNENINAMGFYGFGEMCPTGIIENGKARNRFHNISFAVCAF